MNEREKLLTEALNLAHELDVNWQLYYFSSGTTRGDIVRLAAIHFARVLPSLGIEYTQPDDLRVVRELAKWAHDQKHQWPGKHMYASNLMVLLPLRRLKDDIEKALGLPHFRRDFMSREGAIQERTIFWRRHVSECQNYYTIDEFVEGLNSHESIAVIGDIRQSQTLMERAKDPAIFHKRMCGFIDGIRIRARGCFGVFDKFTGDGFIAYFNPVRHVPYPSELGDHVRSCLAFCQIIKAFASRYLGEWEAEIGGENFAAHNMAIGAEAGMIHFDDSQRELICTGVPIVMASRLAGIAHGDEFIVGERLEKLLKSRQEECRLGEMRSERVKNGRAVNVWPVEIIKDLRRDMTELPIKDREMGKAFWDKIERETHALMRECQRNSEAPDSSPGCSGDGSCH